MIIGTYRPSLKKIKMNIPQGKGVQIFSFQSASQARLAIGTEHYQLKIFQNFRGIRKITILSRRPFGLCRGFQIKGHPNAVDSLMIRIKAYLCHCSKDFDQMEEKALKQKPKVRNKRKNLKIKRQMYRFEKLHYDVFDDCELPKSVRRNSK